MRRDLRRVFRQKGISADSGRQTFFHGFTRIVREFTDFSESEKTVGMLRLHREDRFALLTISLSMTFCLEMMGTGGRQRSAGNQNPRLLGGGLFLTRSSSLVAKK